MPDRSRSGAGIAYMLLTAVCFATSDATVKHLGAVLPVLVLLWSRYVFQTTVMASMQMTRRPWRELVRSGAPRLQAVRSMLLVSNAACSFVGLQYLPLPEYTALVMLAPVISTLLAATWLGERVTPLRWTMVALGFAGMLMIVRPGSGLLGWAVCYPIVAAFFFAFYQAVTQRLAAVDDMVTTNLLSSLGALAVTCVAVMVLPIDTVGALRGASAVEWLLLAGLGAVASLGQLSMTMAIRSAPLSVLTPFSYVQIAFAAFIGWLLFRHSPDHWSLAGMATIAVAGGATVVLNQREKAAVRRALALREATAPAA